MNLSKVQFVINNTYNRSIGTTPSMILFGFNQKGYSDDDLRNFIAEIQGIDTNIEELRAKAK